MSSDDPYTSDTIELIGGERLDPPGDFVVAGAEETVQTFAITMVELVVASTSTSGDDTSVAAQTGAAAIYGGIDDFISIIDQLPAPTPTAETEDALIY